MYDHYHCKNLTWTRVADLNELRPLLFSGGRETQQTFLRVLVLLLDGTIHNVDRHVSMKSKKEILEELKVFEMTIPDGKMKDCLVYHEVTEAWFSEALDEYALSVAIEAMPEEMEDQDDVEKQLHANVWNTAIDQYLENIKKLTNHGIKEFAEHIAEKIADVFKDLAKHDRGELTNSEE